MTGEEVNLVYLGQAGALNESVSDGFSSLTGGFAKTDGRRVGTPQVHCYGQAVHPSSLWAVVSRHDASDGHKSTNEEYAAWES